MGMQITKLNINTSSGIQSFKSEKEPSGKNNYDEDLKIATEFANLSDANLLKMSAQEPVKSFRKTSKDLLKTMLVAVPLVDIAASGLTKKGNLSSKIKQSAMQTGRWAAILGSLGVLFTAKRAVNSRSEEMDNINKNHPILALGMDFAAMMAMYSGIMALKNSSVEFVKDNFTKTVSEFNKKLIEPAKTALNNSYLNKHLILPAEQKIYKHANSKGRGLSIFASLLAPTISIAALAKGFVEAKNTKEKISTNYQFLKMAQETVRNELNNKKDI